MLKSKMDTITLTEIYRFCNGTPTTRNMVEEENVLNSGHIINCGYVNKNQISINLDHHFRDRFPYL
jgi:hypothetical protein